MDKEKQIEEMARVWCPFPERHDCRGCCERCYEISKSEMLYNAGYRKQRDLYQILPDGRLELIPTSDNIKSKFAEDLLSEIKKEAHNKAVHPCGCKIDPYISLKVLDGIIQKYINKYYEESKKDG